MAQAPLAITLGDPAGIGPEIIARAFTQAPHDMAGAVVCGDLAVMQAAARCVGADLALVKIAGFAQAATLGAREIGVVEPQPGLQTMPAPGRVDARCGRFAADCVRLAARAALRGEVGAVVTAPLHKEALAAAGEPWPGHTELLQALAAEAAGVPVQQMPVRMMLANTELRTVLVSIHVSLRQAIEAVTPQALDETLRITHEALGGMLGRAPRMAVAGLNPHAGEGGLFGSEDGTIIAPAVQRACARGWLASGPWAADTVFMRARRGEFDVVIAMYHDQGLIPVKYLGVEQGVNVTLGLPLVRTSPDHGTAFDIAWQGRADASSLVAAVRQARQLAAGHRAGA